MSDIVTVLPSVVAVEATYLCPEASGHRVQIDGKRGTCVVKPSQMLHQFKPTEKVHLIYEMDYREETRGFNGNKFDAGVRLSCKSIEPAVLPGQQSLGLPKPENKNKVA